MFAEGRTRSAQGGMEMGAFDRLHCLAVRASSVMSVGHGEVPFTLTSYTAMWIVHGWIGESVHGCSRKGELAVVVRAGTR